MVKFKEKIFISIVIAMMMIAQIPVNQMIHAQSKKLFEVEITDVDNDSKKIAVREIQESITKIELYLNDENIQTNVASDDLFFNLYVNGTYIVRGFDAQNALKSEESITVETFADFTVEKNEITQEVKFVSRHDLTEKIVINKKEEVSVKKIQPGYYVANYTIPKNGEYTFDVLNSDGQEVASKIIKYTDIPNVNKAGEYIISSEEDVKQIIQNPSGTFILENNIELTSDSLKDVNFTGKIDGKGNMISGILEPLFNSVKNATINNVVIKGALANTSTNATITNTGFYVEASDDNKDSAVILKSDNTTIQHSFAFMNVEGKQVAGFILEGTGTVENSYVSGYLQGEVVYGFGKEVAVLNSYITASLVGEARTLFTSGKLEESFYDAQINDVEDLKATPMYTNELSSKNFKNEEFKVIEGQYPQIKDIENLKEKAQAVSILSVQSVKTKSNLSTLKEKIETKDSEGIEWDIEKDEVRATSANIMNRFAIKETLVETSITAGASTSAKTTQITYPITIGTYYKVLKASEAEPTVPTSHKEAIESGWKIMYWDGSYKQAGLEWNTQYNVYSTKLKAVTTDGTILTNYGNIGGKLTLSGTYDENQTMTATLSGTNTTKGTMYFESAATLDATIWNAVATIPMSEATNNATYQVVTTLKGKYLRARFVADKTYGYQGTLIDKVTTTFKEEIKRVTIVNQTTTSGVYTVHDQLVANMTPAGKEHEVDFEWFHEGGSEPIATGRNYTIKASDVNKKLFVKATAKTDGGFKASKNSDIASAVQPIKHAKPTASDRLKEVSKDDITVTLTMEVAEGLYRYGYREGSTSGEIAQYAILARNKTNTTITGLKANTTYFFYVQQVGENGYSDSDWSNDYIQITTTKEHVKGDVEVSGKTNYNKTLTVALKNSPNAQTGQFIWYRLSDTGTKTEIATNATSYKLVKDDIGKRIEVVYKGIENYTGEVSMITDRISKEEKAAPTRNLTVTDKDDTTITVKMPTNTINEKYIIGVSKSENGVPIKQLEGNTVKELASGASYTITGLQRDVTYYLKVRYAENDTHQESEWIDSVNVISQKTDTKQFAGYITFTYETPNLMRGQTLTANLKPTDTSFEYKGEWKWTRIEAGTNKEIDINNFTLTNNKQGTQYVIPANEDLNVTYKVTFTANVGYAGSVEATSSNVHDIIKEQYEKPIANNIDMEAIDDTSIKVKMNSVEGKYRFWYKEKDQNPWDTVRGFMNRVFIDSNDGYREARTAIDTNVDVLANVDVIIDGLDRNTEYIVRVQRIGDDNGTTSDFTYSTEKTAGASIYTNKTEIAGHVTIEGITRYNETLTATYHVASYASTGTGNDSEGTWQWYRGTTKIPGATKATYKLVQDDINQVVSVKYTIPASHDFIGEVEAKTGSIQKAMGVSPQITKMESKEEHGKITMTVSGNLGIGGSENVYYRLQKASLPAPTVLPTFETSVPQGWYQVTNPTMDIHKDGENLDIEANTEYTIYFIKTATATEESTPLLAQKHKMGKLQQTGIITFTKPTDTKKQTFVVGQTIKANLTSGNNTTGTWKWYMSTVKYDGTTTSAPAPTATTSWKEITSGSSQVPGSGVSELNLSEDMFAHFIRAEFVASNESKYSGTISSTESQYVRKIYDEKLTITSSTKDGFRNPKAYADTVLTGTIDNYVESGDLNRDTVHFKIGSSTITPTITNGTFTYTMLDTASYDGQEITAEVSTPKVIELYVDTNLNAMTTKTLNSKTSTNTSMKYTAGVPINTPDDFYNFMLQEGNYTNRSAEAKYIITSNLNLKSLPSIEVSIIRSKGDFKGTLDGDNHTITGLKNMMLFKTIGTSETDRAEIKNLIINDITTDGNIIGSTGIVSLMGINVDFKNIFLTQANLVSSTNSAGFLMAKTDNGLGGIKYTDGVINIDNCMTAGGSVRAGVDAGGLIGGVNYNHIVNVSNTTSIATYVNGKAMTSGFIGKYNSTSTINGKNLLVASNFDDSLSSLAGGIAGISKADMVGLDSGVTSSFYDVTISPQIELQSHASKGTPKQTNDLIGTNLKTIFNDNSWSYSDGYYPRLSWVNNHPVAKLYTATRGAFTSVDGATSPSNMFNGIMSGPIQIPAELQTKDFTVYSSDSTILKVTDSGTIIPVGTDGQKATITITYTEPDPTIGGSASNAFEFTVGTHINAMDDVSIVDGTTGLALSSAPEMNQVLRANSLQGTTYQWYRRKRGSTTKEMISDATSQTYTVKASDVGYEITVFVSATGYASTYSNFTEAAVSIVPGAPNVSSITDGSVKISASGNSTFEYEFGYMSDENTMITQVNGIHAYDATITVSNLQRNKNYKFYTRIAAASDGSYPASAWSPAKPVSTLKTAVTGTPKLGTAINNGSDLSLNMETTYGQTGMWKLERMEADGTTKVIDIAFSSSNNTDKYTLTAEDVSYRIKATFIGNGDFQGTTSVLSDVIQKSTATAVPSKPTLEGTLTYHTIMVAISDVGMFDVAYATSPSGEKTIVQSNISTGGTEYHLEINDLKYNTDYYIFRRNSETAGTVASAWSDYTHAKTTKAPVSEAITQTGIAKVENSVTFTMPHSTEHNVNYTGTWKVERVSETTSSDVSATISPSNYTVANSQLTYKIDPKDAGNKLKVTFTGNGNFQDSTYYETQNVANAEQVTATASAGVISEVKDHSLKVQMKEGMGTYQFGYMLNNTMPVITVDSTVVAGTNVLIDGLKRNSSYSILVRHAAKQGYDASEWTEISTNQKTDKSVLTGAVEYSKVENEQEVAAKVGVAEVNATYKAKYLPGKYAQTGSDTNGKWQWYADGEPIAGAINAIYTIAPMTNVDEITVRFIADDTSDFKNYRSASIGTLTKPSYEQPSVLPTVTAVSEDGTIGSKLKIESNEVDNVFYYVQKAENTNVPATTLASSVQNNEEKVDQWFKATSDMTLNLEANTKYVVYVARLEDGSYLSSGVISQRAVNTVKEDISKITDITITEADSTKWKVLQDKELRIHCDGTSVEGIWQYYVKKTQDDDASWQNITAEIKAKSTEDKTSTYNFSKVNVPLKYANGYYFRAVFTGREDFEGSKIYTSSDPLIGTQLKGSAIVTTGNTPKVFVPIKVNYVYAKENGQDIVDEQNGIWTWYREEINGDIKIKTGTVGTSDEYTPTAEDAGKKIYAIYAGATEGIYSGSVTSNTIENVKRATQNTPEAITIKQVSGTRVQIILPTNMETKGNTIAQAQLAYRIKNTTTWITNKAGGSWITDLKANTDYEVKVQFLATSEYEASAYGTSITVKTGNQSFDEESLIITQPTILQSGDIISATYSGSGYDEGYFIIKRSDGTVILDNVAGTITNEFWFKSGSTKIQYQVANDDIGSNIIIEYKAKTNATTYGGSIEKSTKEVVKPINSTTAVTPTLNKVPYDETVLRVNVNDVYEYVLNESSAPVNETSGDWQKLTKDKDQAYHTFTNLSKTKDYYLHVRVAETQNYRNGQENVSVATKPWASTQYTITYEGTEQASHQNPNQYTDLDAEIILQDASKNGYTFRGWTRKAEDTPQKGLTIPAHSSGNMTFTAHWTIKQYTVGFDSNGGSTTSTTIKKDYNAKLGPLPTPTRIGHTFKGWYTNKDGGDKISENTLMPLNGATYYAHWTINTYTVNFDSQTGSAVAPQTINHGEKVMYPSVPTKEGYRFGGWYKDDPNILWDFDVDKVIGTMTLQAKWDEKFTLSFDANTGTGSMSSVEFIETDSITLPSNTFTKKGFSFVGWNTQADGKGRTYQAWQILNQVLITNTTLYATWKADGPAVFVDIPNGLSLVDDKENNVAIAKNYLSILKDPADSAWYPNEEIHVYTSPMITLKNDDTNDKFDLEVFKADGTKYTVGNDALAILNVKDENKQSSEFSLKTPISYSKFRGMYTGSTKFTMEFKSTP